MKYEQTTHKSLAKIICNMSRSSASGTAAECLGVMLLIIAWFNENEDSFIVRKEVFQTDAEIENQGLPLPPCIVARGMVRELDHNSHATVQFSNAN